MIGSEKRPNRDVSAHTRRRTLEDEQGQGRVNVEGMDKNYYYHVVNDKNGKVERLKRRGFDVVENDGHVTMGDATPAQTGTAIQTTVDNKDGTKGVLMRIPREFKEEDDAYRQKQIDKSEEALYRQAENEAGCYGKIEVEIDK